MLKKKLIVRRGRWSTSPPTKCSKTKIKVYRFWKLRFFYKFFIRHDNKSIFIKSYSYKRMVRGERFRNGLKFIFLLSFYASFLETQFIYCIFGYLGFISDTNNLFAEIFFPTLYFFLYFTPKSNAFFSKLLEIFWSKFKLLFYNNFSAFFLLFNFWNIFFVQLFTRNLAVNTYVHKPLTFSKNHAIASKPFKTLLKFIVCCIQNFKNNVSS